MDKQEIQEKVIAITADLFHKDKDEITPETDFVQDLHAKSIDIIGLIAALEGEFQVNIPPGDVKKNNTVGKAMSWLDQKLNK
jgi:acyl carrier protein